MRISCQRLRRCNDVVEVQLHACRCCFSDSCEHYSIVSALHAQQDNDAMSVVRHCLLQLQGHKTECVALHAPDEVKNSLHATSLDSVAFQTPSGAQFAEPEHIC